ncbi:MAG: SDR family NAD(P)-dependent oxidoreductase [Hyphomicrobiaceae bacterium]|nr:MAG: SDR family NAD(P)-dependent oxidoreductase [Hyphomicrobiaceae bacterium]
MQLADKIISAWRSRYRVLRGPRDRAAGLKPAIVVTGGSEGIGRALAEEFARLGDTVFLVARSGPALEEARVAIAAKTGVEVRTIIADLTSPDGPGSLLGSLARDGFYCDVLLNNAAAGLSGPFVEHEEAALANLIALNVGALTGLMHAVLPDMIARGRGGILNVASLGGLAPGPWQAAYYASKAYVVSLTEAVAYETRGLGVRIAVLLPGPTGTQFHHRMGADSAYYLRLLPPASPARVARWAFWGWRFGGVKIVASVENYPLALALWLVPNVILKPILGFILKNRSGRRHARHEGEPRC